MIPGILLSIAGTFYLGKQTSKDYDFMIKIFLVMGILGLVITFLFAIRIDNKKYS